jgi:hypothetical protein
MKRGKRSKRGQWLGLQLRLEKITLEVGRIELPGYADDEAQAVRINEALDNIHAELVEATSCARRLATP